MERTAALPRPELLQVADAVARDKGIDRDEVLEAMEQAIQKAGRSKYGHEHDIRATIDRKNGEIQLTRVITVVETVENESAQMTVQQARKKKPDARARRHFRRSTAADRFRPHRRADRQAGDRAARARRRTSTANTTNSRTAPPRSSTVW